MPHNQTLNLGQYKLTIPPDLKLNGKRDQIEEEIKRVLEESGFFSKAESADTEPPSQREGLRLTRYYTLPDQNPLDMVKWIKRDCKIANPDGSVIYEMKNAEIPEHFSQVASDIMIAKYFRKAGVPLLDDQGRQLINENGSPRLGPEQSAKQVISRMVGCWRSWGEKYGYFKSQEDAQIFEDELKYSLVHQIAAPNSPQWFNTGIAWAYQITGKPQGHYYVDPISGLLNESSDAYTRPQPHACFIQSVRDDLVGYGGIMDLWIREARIFKYGSGTGSNFSAIRGRGEPLSGGGTSSGLISFLKIGDRAAGAIKSGGTTRRAAKMVCLDIDHPEIETFIKWKAQEEKKVQALVSAGYSSDFEGEAYETASGQNSNNSVRISNEFMQAVADRANWQLRWRTDGRVCKEIPATELWHDIAQAAWTSADPGIQFNTTINEWHTCPKSGPIRASNPCSEFMFLDDTACNLASLNLMKFYDTNTGLFDVEAFKYSIKLWTLVLEISVLMAQFPSPEIAQNSYDFRPLGLGYANLGTLLMVQGLSYESEAARAYAATITAILTGTAYAMSAQLAAILGPFAKYQLNKKSMLKVLRNHRRAAYGETTADQYEDLTIKPQPLKADICPDYLVAAARASWDEALELANQFGLRNAQVTVLAPTGTIGLLMDCDTTGVEPDFALVKFKKLAGGGYWKMPNQSLEPALRNLGYNQQQISDIIEYIIGKNKLTAASLINREQLLAKGLTAEEIQKIESELPRVFDIKYAFNKHLLNEETFKRLGVSNEQYIQADFNLLNYLGFSAAEQADATRIICGHMTIEGAPYLQAEHLSIFDCANRCGEGVRFIPPMGHVKMLAAVQPFITGSISKTVNLPTETSVEEIQDIYWQSWQSGLKAVALYRDGCKLSQPLNASKSTKNTDGNDQTKKPGSQLSFIERGTKKDLPARRLGFTVESTVAGHKIFLRTGEYEDGTLGEIFIDMHKEGAAVRSLLNCFAIAVSLGLQYGVPLKKLVEKFTFTRFEPNGVTDHPNIKTATSLIDFMFRVLGMEYLNRMDFVHIPPSNLDTAPAMDTLSDFASNLMGDAPACNECGHITVRNGSCYRCLNCGASMGCS